jgi:hypothetical protein
MNDLKFAFIRLLKIPSLADVARWHSTITLFAYWPTDRRAAKVNPMVALTVERARVQIGNSPWNIIPEAVPVELTISKGEIALTAESVTIKQTIN